MGKCEKCLYYKSKTKCGECGRLSNAMDNNPMFTPNTNYDRIKLMSVDEMADKIYLSKCNCCKLLDEAKIPHPWHCTTSCRKYIKQWLLQEVSENE